MDEQVKNLVAKLSSKWGAEVVGVKTITPDASMRRYYRLELGKCRPIEADSAVLMVFDSLSSGESGGAVKSIGMDQAYVELSEYFFKKSIPIPKLYFVEKELNSLLIEDLGSFQLADAIIGDFQKEYSVSEVETLYKQAIDYIQKIQSLSFDNSCFFFNRGFNSKVFISEMMEFWDYFLIPNYGNAVNKELITAAFVTLATDLEKSPYTLVHRDYHSWNLLVDSKGAVRIIDFQDALMGPRNYDIVGLLNDRDTDAALGDELYIRLLNYYIDALADDEQALYREYDLALLQRDLKVVGRFSKLAETRGLLSYKLWIPGTLRRIGRTLERITSVWSVSEQYHLLFDELHL